MKFLIWILCPGQKAQNLDGRPRIGHFEGVWMDDAHLSSLLMTQKTFQDYSYLSRTASSIRMKQFDYNVDNNACAERAWNVVILVDEKAFMMTGITLLQVDSKRAWKYKVISEQDCLQVKLHVYCRSCNAHFQKNRRRSVSVALSKYPAERMSTSLISSETPLHFHRTVVEPSTEA